MLSLVRRYNGILGQLQKPTKQPGLLVVLGQFCSDHRWGRDQFSFMLFHILVPRTIK
jgi:hypothetical protein